MRRQWRALRRRGLLRARRRVWWHALNWPGSWRAWCATARLVTRSVARSPMATWLVTRSVAPSVARPAPAHSWRARRSRAQLGGASRGELDDTLGGAVATCVGVGRWGRASGFASGLAGRTSDAATTGACAWRSRDGGGVHLEAMGLGSWLGARAASRRRADNAWRARCRRVCSAASRRASLLAHVVHRLTEGEGGPALRPAQK